MPRYEILWNRISADAFYRHTHVAGAAWNNRHLSPAARKRGCWTSRTSSSQRPDGMPRSWNWPDGIPGDCGRWGSLNSLFRSTWEDAADTAHVLLGVFINGSTPNSSILVGFSFINNPFWGTPMTMETPISMAAHIHGGQEFWTSPARWTMGIRVSWLGRGHSSKGKIQTRKIQEFSIANPVGSWISKWTPVTPSSFERKILGGIQTGLAVSKALQRLNSDRKPK